MNLNIPQPANIVVDCDEILCNISPIWTKKLIENKEKFESYMDFSEIENLDENQLYDKVLERPVFYLNLWLKKKDVNITDEEKNRIMNDFIGVYDTEDFYTYVQPTEMAITLAKLSYTNMVKKVYVVTRCTENNIDIKSEFIKSIFPESKLEIRIVKGEHKKSDYIKDIDMTNGLIFEDELSNIKDYIENCPTLTEMNFYIPLLGYNHPNQDLYDMCDNNKIGLIYYPIERRSEV